MLVVCFCKISQIFSVFVENISLVYKLSGNSVPWDGGKGGRGQSGEQYCDCPPSEEINQQSCCFSKCADCGLSQLERDGQQKDHQCKDIIGTGNTQIQFKA